MSNTANAAVIPPMLQSALTEGAGAFTGCGRTLIRDALYQGATLVAPISA